MSEGREGADEPGQTACLVVYPVKTHWPWVIFAGVCLFAVLVLPAFVLWPHLSDAPADLFRHIPARLVGLLSITSVVLLVLPIVIVQSVRTYYWVRGTQGEVRLHAQFLEFVSPGRPTLRIDYRELDFETHDRRHVYTFYFLPVASRRLRFVRLRSRTDKLTLGMGVFENPERYQAFVDDLERVRVGAGPMGWTRQSELAADRRETPGAAPGQTDVYDDVLDEELDRFDD